jgi:hypothetical protein
MDRQSVLPIWMLASFDFEVDAALLLVGERKHPAHPIPRYRAFYLFPWANQTCGTVP